MSNVDCLCELVQRLNLKVRFLVPLLADQARTQLPYAASHGVNWHFEVPYCSMSEHAQHSVPLCGDSKASVKAFHLQRPA